MLISLFCPEWSHHFRRNKSKSDILRIAAIKNNSSNKKISLGQLLLIQHWKHKNNVINLLKVKI